MYDTVSDNGPDLPALKKEFDDWVRTFCLPLSVLAQDEKAERLHEVGRGKFTSSTCCLSR